MGETARVIQQRAGTQMILVEGLIFPVLHEQRGFIGFQKGVLFDVAVCVMNKGAWLDVSVGVDMEIRTAAGNAAFYIFAVIPEIQSKDGLWWYMNSRCAAVTIKSGTASLPTGI